jgi:hypothetical protein
MKCHQTIKNYLQGKLISSNIFSRYERLKTGFGLVTVFIKQVQVVTTTINYYTVTDFHANLFGLSALVFTDL